jgi:hypothetical protein
MASRSGHRFQFSLGTALLLIAFFNLIAGLADWIVPIKAFHASLVPSVLSLATASLVALVVLFALPVVALVVMAIHLATSPHHHGRGGRTQRRWSVS